MNSLGIRIPGSFQNVRKTVSSNMMPLLRTRTMKTVHYHPITYNSIPKKRRTIQRTPNGQWPLPLTGFRIHYAWLIYANVFCLHQYARPRHARHYSRPKSAIILSLIAPKLQSKSYPGLRNTTCAPKKLYQKNSWAKFSKLESGPWH